MKQANRAHYRRIRAPCTKGSEHISIDSALDGHQRGEATRSHSGLLNGRHRECGPTHNHFCEADVTEKKGTNNKKALSCAHAFLFSFWDTDGMEKGAKSI